MNNELFLTFLEKTVKFAIRNSSDGERKQFLKDYNFDGTDGDCLDFDETLIRFHRLCEDVLEEIKIRRTAKP